MSSMRFRRLRGRIFQLRKNLLPKNFSPTGLYSEQVRDHARGFRVLVHAEIEAYVEECAREVVDSALRSWHSKKKAQLVLLSLTVYWGWKSESQKENLKSVHDGVHYVVGQYFERLKNNHGIGEYNLKALLCPIGMDFKSLDTAWVASMGSFSRKRGGTAHTGSATASEIDPADELKTVKELLRGLEKLDRKFEAL